MATMANGMVSPVIYHIQSKKSTHALIRDVLYGLFTWVKVQNFQNPEL